MSALTNLFKQLLQSPLEWQIEAVSLTGEARAHNEDSVGFAGKAGTGFAVLADGVGGHQAGEVASRSDNHHPVWSPDGRQIYYLAGPGRFEEVAVTTGRGVGFGTAVTLQFAPLRGQRTT